MTLELLNALVSERFHRHSIDAMVCQRAIAEKIIDRGAGYMLVVRGNQTNLHLAIEDAFLDRKDLVVHLNQEEQGHGLLVAQRCAVISRIDSLRQVKVKLFGMTQRYYLPRAG